MTGSVITLPDGRAFPADPEARIAESRARIVAVKAGAVVTAEQRAAVAAFDAEQVAAGRQMTGEAVKQNQDYAERLKYATELQKYADKEGCVSSELYNECKPLLFGYRLPAGITVQAAHTFYMLQVARRAGFQQGHIDAYLRAEMELNK